MIDSTAPIDAPPDAEAVAAEPLVEQPVVEAPAVDEDVLEPELQAQVIDIPDGDKLVPLSALTATRKALKAAKQAATDSPALKQQLEQAQQQLQAVAPLADAFRALQQAPQQQPAPVAPVEDTTELDEIARDFDFFRADGTPDLDKARRVQTRETKRATAIAQQQTAPLVHNTLTERAQHNIERAKATTLPGTTEKADPVILDGMIQQILQQPNGLQMLASHEAMIELWKNAYVNTQIARTARGGGQPPAPVVPKPAVVPTAPVFRESAGGHVAQAKPLSAMEKRAAKDAGMTEDEFKAIAKDKPW